MWRMFQKRIHESVALSAYLSAALTLQLAWVMNLLVHREPVIRELMTISSMGPISGLYLSTFFIYIFLFGSLVLFLRGRDCAYWQTRMFWFLVISIVIFLVMTFPAVYEFSVSVE